MGRPRRHANATERQRAHRQKQKDQDAAYTRLVALQEEAAQMHLVERFDVPVLQKHATAEQLQVQAELKERDMSDVLWVADAHCRLWLRRGGDAGAAASAPASLSPAPPVCSASARKSGAFGDSYAFEVAVAGVQIPDRRYRYTWRSAVPTSHCRCTRTTMPQSA